VYPSEVDTADQGIAAGSFHQKAAAMKPLGGVCIVETGNVCYVLPAWEPATIAVPGLKEEWTLVAAADADKLPGEIAPEVRAALKSCVLWNAHKTIQVVPATRENVAEFFAAHEKAICDQLREWGRTWPHPESAPLQEDLLA
jgi:hypothetical protein